MKILQTGRKGRHSLFSLAFLPLYADPFFPTSPQNNPNLSIQFPLPPSPFTGKGLASQEAGSLKSKIFKPKPAIFITMLHSCPGFVSTFWSRGQQEEQPSVQTPRLGRIKNPVQCFDA